MEKQPSRKRIIARIFCLVLAALMVLSGATYVIYALLGLI